jgi:hypothetical protein
MASECDWSTLTVESETFVDENNRSLYADVLYGVQVGGYPVRVYVLLEHKSSSEALTIHQLSRYVAAIHARYVKQTEGKLPLPVVMPLVLHHSETGWKAPTELVELYGDAPEVLPWAEPYLLKLKCKVFDISRVSDEELKAWALGAVTSLALWALRDARNLARLRRTIGFWAGTMMKLGLEPSGVGALHAVLRYISQVSDEKVEDLIQAMIEGAPAAKEHIMTVAEQLRQEGRDKGRLEGRTSALQEQLEDKFGPLSHEVVGRLQSATEEQLGRWAKRILTADSIQAVFGE